MRRVISFHAVDLEFFDSVIDPLVSGGKINPEPYLAAALAARSRALGVQRFRIALELQLELLKPPPALEQGSLWQKMRSRLERLEYRPEALAAKVGAHVEADLHLYGRPYLITEGSADRVAAALDAYEAAADPAAVEALVREQLGRADPALAREIAPVETDAAPADMSYRSELLQGLKEIHDLAHAARSGDSWPVPGSTRHPALDVLVRELPWRALRLHGRIRPFWIGRDVDGLDAICRAAGFDSPECLVPARRLFAHACESFAGLRERLGLGLDDSPTVGAWVSPADLDELLEFLSAHGSRIIQAATRLGEGATAATLLRKIRECASYAKLHGRGYLEAAGLWPIEIELAAPEGL